MVKNLADEIANEVSSRFVLPAAFCLVLANQDLSDCPTNELWDKVKEMQFLKTHFEVEQKVNAYSANREMTLILLQINGVETRPENKNLCNYYSVLYVTHGATYKIADGVEWRKRFMGKWDGQYFAAAAEVPDFYLHFYEALQALLLEKAHIFIGKGKN